MVDEPSARDALSFARERIEAGEFDDAATLDANYLRRTDAEIFAKQASLRVSS
jgi:tRNA threonylcarbamoyladenosine biosynthesis protein TsaB